MSRERPQKRQLSRSVTRDTYAPAYLSLISNALCWGGSRIFLREFGVGTNEWRVMSAVVNEPGSTASVIGDVVGLNKAVVSRSVRLLRDRGYLSIEPDRGRRRVFATRAGERLHDHMTGIALRRQEILLTGFSAAERGLLFEFLRRMHGNLPALAAFDPHTER
ncbi:MarR family winged helix-turn-helix transcriptional regulator [Gandjariella thermophila]|uniref:Transcriptional regulator n=1 Tax=Gandjariella thermophila TaxID=1931992 RepID=A0A4D4J5F4_9PSEU|nr:MarR family winged helix-turn-helix transcriptional regulator [Gandjariella thermophila]GDY29819.1 transcriptional regulator [Gandjariella thermophila]